MTSGEGRGRGGPFVRGAFFCERVLQEQSGVSSYIRVVDQTTINAQIVGQAPEGVEVPPLPPDLPEFNWDIVLALLFTAGDARGRHVLSMEMEPPDGIKVPLGQPGDIHFNQSNAGVNVHINLRLSLKQEGVHWIHVLLDEKEATQVPLQVMYQRTPSPVGS